MQRYVITEPPRIATTRRIQTEPPNPLNTTTGPKPNTNVAGLTLTSQRLQGVKIPPQTQPPPGGGSPVQGTSIAVGTANNQSTSTGDIPQTKYDLRPKQNFASKQNQQITTGNNQGNNPIGDASASIPAMIEILPMTQLQTGNNELLPTVDPELTKSMIIKSILEEWQNSPERWPLNNIEQLQVMDPGDGTLENAIYEAFPDGSFSLSILKATGHFFIEPKSPSFGHEHPSFERKFDILDTNGDRLFIAAETKGTRNFVRCGRKLNLSLFGNNGREILDFSWTGGKKVEHNSQGRMSGRIEELVPCCSGDSFFQIKDGSGKIIYKIVHNWSTECSYEFEVLTPAGELRIGKVSKTWIGFPQHLAHLYGISFLPDTSLLNKTCLLVTVFILYFKFAEDKNRHRRRLESGCLYLILYVLLIMAFFLGLAISVGYIYRTSLK